MSYPVAFGRYCDDMVGGSYRDKDRMWRRVGDTEPQMAASYKSHATNGKLRSDLQSKLKDVHRSLRKSGANRGHRDGAATAKTPVRGSPPAAGGVPQLEEMILVDYAFQGPEGELEDVPFDDVIAYESGWCKGSRNKTANVLYHNMEEQPYDAPAAILCKAAAFEHETSEMRKKLIARYRPRYFSALWDFKGILKQVECILFQLGSTDVEALTYGTEAKQVTTASSKFVQVSVQYPNLSEKADFANGGKANFAKDVVLAASAKFIYDDFKPVITNTLKDVKYRRDTMTMHIGKILIKNEHLEELWNRSGMTNDVFFRPWEKSDEWATVTFPPSVTIAEIREHAKRVAALHTASLLALGALGFA